VPVIKSAPVMPAKAKREYRAFDDFMWLGGVLVHRANDRIEGTGMCAEDGSHTLALMKKVLRRA
jgi:hypothetical protein